MQDQHISEAAAERTVVTDVATGEELWSAPWRSAPFIEYVPAALLNRASAREVSITVVRVPSATEPCADCGGRGRLDGGTELGGQCQRCAGDGSAAAAR